MRDLWWLGAGLAVALPALLVAAAGRRFLVATMAAWFVSPVFVYLGFIAFETLTRPEVRYPPGTALYGFMLVSPILLPPWLAVCLAGFGIGLGMRRLLRRDRHGRTAPPLVPAAVQPKVPAVEPVSRPLAEPPAETPGWRHVHIGFDNDGLRIGGLDVWAHKWRQASGPPVRLAHPTHPNQMHSYEAYAIGDAANPVRFAACELSNGVWGFSIRQDDPVGAQGTSRDGTLRYEHCLGEFIGGRYDSVSPAAVLTDAASGQVLVDCSAWGFSQIVPNADGSLFLRLRQNFFEVLFRIDPVARQFWNHGEGGPRHTLGGLAVAVEQARQSAGQAGGGADYRQISPDATIRVDLATAEWSNSHWVNSPRVVEIISGRVVLDLWKTDWDATASFPRLRCVKLDLRRYRRGGQLAVEIDLARNTYQIVAPSGPEGPRPAAPLAEVASALEAESARLAACNAPVRRPAPSPWAAWRAALLITAAAFIAIAGATVLSLQGGQPGGQATPPLAKIPRPALPLR